MRSAYLYFGVPQTVKGPLYDVGSADESTLEKNLSERMKALDSAVDRCSNSSDDETVENLLRGDGDDDEVEEIVDPELVDNCNNSQGEDDDDEDEDEDDDDEDDIDNDIDEVDAEASVEGLAKGLSKIVVEDAIQQIAEATRKLTVEGMDEEEKENQGTHQPEPLVKQSSKEGESQIPPPSPAEMLAEKKPAKKEQSVNGQRKQSVQNELFDITLLDTLTQEELEFEFTEGTLMADSKVKPLILFCCFVQNVLKFVVVVVVVLLYRTSKL